MKTTLEIVIALTTSLLVTGAAVGAGIVGACAVSAGGCYWLWKHYRKRHQR